MSRLRLLLLCLLVCVLVAGCDDSKGRRSRPTPNTGSVAGVVLCSDTGKPARFATVILTAVPQPGDSYTSGVPLKSSNTGITDLEGRFRIDAVSPGAYYVFAWMPGYVDPVASLNAKRFEGITDDKARQADAIEQLKDHMVAVSVKAHREIAVTLSMDRAAEITGTVTYEDGTPASSMHFDLLRRVNEKTWTGVGMMEANPWVFHSRSDNHGQYKISDLLPGEYKICAQFPSYDNETPASWCLGNTYRFKDAEIIKLQPGEVTSNVNIEIPLSGMHTVSGTVNAMADGHVLTRGTVRLLYADDRETAREVDVFDDGGFVFDYVPEDGFILLFTEFREEVPVSPDVKASGAQPTDSKPTITRNYADREIRVDVQDDIADMTVTLSPKQAEKITPQTQ